MVNPVVKVGGAVSMKVVHAFEEGVVCLELHREWIVRGEEVEASVQLAAGGVGVKLIAWRD